MKINTTAIFCIFPNMMLGHLELSIAGAPMSYHRTSGPTPKKTVSSLSLPHQEREMGPDGVDIESNGPVVGTCH